MNEEEGTLKQRVAKAVQQVAEELGNKPATCRKFYIHPLVLSEYENGRLASLYQKAVSQAGGRTKAEEKLLLRLLEKAS